MEGFVEVQGHDLEHVDLLRPRGTLQRVPVFKPRRPVGECQFVAHQLREDLYPLLDSEELPAVPRRLKSMPLAVWVSGVFAVGPLV